MLCFATAPFIKAAYTSAAVTTAKKEEVKLSHASCFLRRFAMTPLALTMRGGTQEAGKLGGIR